MKIGIGVLDSNQRPSVVFVYSFVGIKILIFGRFLR